MNGIERLRQYKNLTQQQLADMVNTSAPQIQRLEKGQRRLTVEWISRLAKALQCTEAEVAGFPTLDETATASYTAQGALQPDAPDVPFYAWQMPVEPGTVVLPSEADDLHPTPQVLTGVEGAYILTMPDNCMAPRYSEGTRLHVSPQALPAPGKGVVVRLPGNRALVAEYARGTRSSVAVRHYNQQPELTIPRHRIVAIHTIVGTEEA